MLTIAGSAVCRGSRVLRVLPCLVLPAPTPPSVVILHHTLSYHVPPSDITYCTSIMAKATRQKAPKSAKQKGKYLTRKDANVLLIESELALQTASKHLEAARELCAKAGLSVDATIVPRADAIVAPVDTGGTTGGHSNTDHVVVRTGSKRDDRIAELKRNMLRRQRSMQPEHRGEDRCVWTSTQTHSLAPNIRSSICLTFAAGTSLVFLENDEEGSFEKKIYQRLLQSPLILVLSYS